MFSSRPAGSATVLPTSALSDLSHRATVILNHIQRFFSHHLINTYGCDYSSSGLTAESIESKLKSFFQRQTVDGPRYDTYLVYYSGHVHENGDWALAGRILGLWLRVGPCFIAEIWWSHFKAVLPLFNTLRPRQNGGHFADEKFNCIFLSENLRILIQICF